MENQNNDPKTNCIICQQYRGRDILNEYHEVACDDCRKRAQKEHTIIALGFPDKVLHLEDEDENSNRDIDEDANQDIDITYMLFKADVFRKVMTLIGMPQELIDECGDDGAFVTNIDTLSEAMAICVTDEDDHFKLNPIIEGIQPEEYQRLREQFLKDMQPNGNVVQIQS